ncbi:hypothetical protein ABTZ03_20750 [Kitasatospora sp. NPDC096077]|uniref:hypothetical protein n=1 Tax=Kitasatospora sp. NPDC096077 TaxID=3155544 RepID=UPI00332563AB
MTHRPSTSTRVGGALFAASALIPAAAASYALAVTLPTDTERYRAYTTAAACPAGSPGATIEECVRTVPFTVNGTVVHSAGKSSKFRATLDGSPYWSGETGFDDAGPLLESLKPGDRVDGTVWRGRVMRLEKAGVTQATHDAPRDEVHFAAGLGTLNALVAVFTAALGALHFTGRPGIPALARPLFLLTLVICAAPTVLACWAGLPWWTVPAVAVPVSLLAARALLRHHEAQLPAGSPAPLDGRLPA